MAEWRRDHDLSRFSSSSDPVIQSSTTHGKDFLPNTMPGFQHPSGSPVFNAATQKIPCSPSSSFYDSLCLITVIRSRHCRHHSSCTDPSGQSLRNDHHRLLNLFLGNVQGNACAHKDSAHTHERLDVCRRFSQNLL